MKLFFRKEGEGQAVIILHGLFGSSDNWMNIAKSLSSKYTVFIPDLRNHGQSPWSEDWDYESMAEDLFDWMKDEKLENPNIIGHSMGGKVVLKALLKNAGLFKKVMVVDIGPKQYPVHHQQILDALNSMNLPKYQNRQEAEEALADKIHSSAIRLFLLKNLKRGKDGFSWKMNLEVIDRLIENIGEPQWPETACDKEILFIRGEASDYITDSDQEEIRTKYPAARFVGIKDAGHWVHAEQPDVFLQFVSGYLSRG
jgi:esterase